MLKKQRVASVVKSLWQGLVDDGCGVENREDSDCPGVVVVVFVARRMSD